jgi:Fur family peroxide stress response transcriptional regulator
MEAFEKLCRKHGLPITSQRRIMLEEFLEMDIHPTADQVYERVVSRLPATSRTTVYRTLETLVDLGLICRTCHPGRPVRYDRRTDVHHHLVCLRCDSILDISNPGLDSIRLPDTTAFGFNVTDYRVQIRGVCRKCAKTNKAKPTTTKRK